MFYDVGAVLIGSIAQGTTGRRTATPDLIPIEPAPASSGEHESPMLLTELYWEPL